MIVTKTPGIAALLHRQSLVTRLVGFGKPVTRGIFQAGIALAVIPALACSSNQEFQKLGHQIEDLQVHTLRLQKESPTKEELVRLESSLGGQIETLLEAADENRADLADLRERIEALETKLGETNFELTKLNQLISATNEELQAIRNAAEAAREVAKTSPTPSVSADTDPRELYDTAYNDYQQGSFDLAILAFHQYLESFPDNELADNATYWIGECFYLQGRFQQAIEQYDEVLSRFEASDRTPSALLKKGYAYLELGQRAQGIVQLQNVTCEYGGTDEAHLARQRLSEMGIDVDC